MNFEDFIESKKWMNLISISDKGKGGLRAVVCNAERRQLPRDITGKHVSEIMKMPIEYEKAPCYEFNWPRYLMFTVRDETYASASKDDLFNGHAIRRFSKSWLLDSAPQITYSTEVSPAPIIHFGIYCLDSIVDILAYEEPIITQLEDI